MNNRMQSDEDLKQEIKRLLDEKDLAKDRMKMARSDAGKIIIKDLTDEIESIRLLYKNINTSRHSNIVVAELSQIIGREKEIIKQLEKWTEAKNKYERVDKELKICQKELTVRNVEKENRRI